MAKSILLNLPGLAVGIKWPNDLLIHNRKVCGILTELKAEADLLHYLVIGIGLNVNTREEDFPADLKSSATSLFLENSKQLVSRHKLAASLLQEMDSSYLDYFKSGPGAVISEWKKYNVTLGKEVTIKTVKGNYSGYAVDLDVNGALIIEDAKGHKNGLVQEKSPWRKRFKRVGKIFSRNRFLEGPGTTTQVGKDRNIVF